MIYYPNSVNVPFINFKSYFGFPIKSIEVFNFSVTLQSS